MGGGNRGGLIQFADLRLRLVTVDGGVRSIRTRASDGACLADVQSEVSISALRQEALNTLAGPATERARLGRLGQALGLAAFPAKVGETISSVAAKSPIRVRISADIELCALPWELSKLKGFASTNDGYVALQSMISLTHDVGFGAPVTRRNSGTPRVLVAWANPGSTNYPFLHFAEKEAASVMRALRSAECSSIHVDELPYATVSSLLRSLADRRPDVLHFIGHGDATPSGGTIVLEGGMPATDAYLYAEDLAEAVVKAGTSFAVLSGCLTSGSPTAIGMQLANAGVPAVLAMSMQIEDASAHQFARALYSSLAEGSQLEEAVFEGRCAIAGTGCDWAAPQLMLAGSEAIVLSAQGDSSIKWKSVEHKTNLTYDDRPFIGRVKERADLRRKIRDQGQRLVTITGPGGMGKTRLSRQVAAELLHEFPEGIWFVDCESLIGEQELVAGIAAEVPFCSGAESKQSLKDCLARSRMLLVLDCFENSVSQGALADELLHSATNLYILVTSRIVLGLPREFEYQLPPMATAAKAGETADSVSLFAEAAGHAIDGFSVTAKNHKLLRELCGSLEGVPLAIVLAAGRLRHMGLAELIQQVQDQPVATLRRRTGGIERHSNIESVVAGSFNLLPPAEKSVLSKLGLFVGAFTIADAAFVCDQSEKELIARLSDLRDHSLVQIQRDEIRTRYKLLDTVRDYLSRLSTEPTLVQELAECRRRHAEYFTRHAIEIGRLMSEGRWSAGTSAMMQELGNLRAAIGTAAGLRRHDLISALISSLARRFFEAGLLTDFRSLADAGYSAADATADPSIRIQLLGLDGALASRHGDEPTCERLWMERVELCRRENDMEHCADTLIDLAWQAFENHAQDKCRLRLIDALRIARSVNDPTFIATAKVVQARIAFASSNFRLARLRSSQAEALLPDCAYRSGVLFVYQNLIIVSRELGDFEKCVDLTLQLLRLSIERRQVIHIGWALLELAPMYEQTKQPILAGRCYLGAMKVHAEYATKHRTRAATALAQFKKRHPEVELATALAALRNKPWQEIVEGLA